MNFRVLLSCCLTFILFFAANAFSGEKPNVVLIIADDISWNDFGCYGNQIVKTLNIDKRVSDGILYGNAAIPTSGLRRIGITKNQDNNGAAELHTGLPKREISIPFLVKQNEYDNPDFFIKASFDSVNLQKTQVEIENQFYRVAFYSRSRQVKKFGDSDFCIRDWFLKSTKQDQVEVCIDGSALRPACTKIEKVYDDQNKKILEFTYGDSVQFKQRYTFYANNMYIKIEYQAYPTDWFNTVDIGTPGGITNRFMAETQLYGLECRGRKTVYHDRAIWNLNVDREKSIYQSADTLGTNAIVYKNHFIMVVGNPHTGVGFGRIMPKWSENRGGIRTLKLLWNLGFETFPATGDQTVGCNKAFAGFIFLFDNGLGNALEIGKDIVRDYLENDPVMHL